MALNNSVSKQQFSFSKSSRFPTLKDNTRNSSPSVFNKPSDFNKTLNFQNASSFAFGSHERRFDPYATSTKNGKLPDPMSYATQPKTFSPDVARSKGWSLSLGRGEMNKLHIDRINDEAQKKISSPCPGNYEKSKTFGASGPHFSVRKRLNRYGNRVDKFDNYYFDAEKKLPGPGNYAHAETVGTRMMSSTFVSSRQSSIPKANDRFRAPAIPKLQPSPNQYSPQADIVKHVKSNHPKVATCKFGLDNSNVLEARWGKKAALATPGPGSYNRFSDFNGNQ